MEEMWELALLHLDINWMSLEAISVTYLILNYIYIQLTIHTECFLVVTRPIMGFCHKEVSITQQGVLQREVITAVASSIIMVI